MSGSETTHQLASRTTRRLAIVAGVLVIGQLTLWLIGPWGPAQSVDYGPLRICGSSVLEELIAEVFDGKPRQKCFRVDALMRWGGLAALAFVLLLALARPVIRAVRWMRVPSHSDALLRVGKQVALWAIVVAVVFALGIAWTGGLYTVTIDKPHGRVYRINRLTGGVEVFRCANYSRDEVICPGLND